ncbi:MAG: ATP-binding protein, partial [Clostridia bacterium]|nr:ATP-binding protein [Clostridia bacterium]
MKKINVLTNEMANKIAAGEVVERPASVIKELVENSVDAGATNLIIEIKNGGISYIRVTDNGCGISPEDIKTAFLPHATSKIVTEDDLFSIKTLGF